MTEQDLKSEKYANDVTLKGCEIACRFLFKTWEKSNLKKRKMYK